jgi:hypothetical protein
MGAPSEEVEWPGDMVDDNGHVHCIGSRSNVPFGRIGCCIRIAIDTIT